MPDYGSPYLHSVGRTDYLHLAFFWVVLNLGMYSDRELLGDKMKNSEAETNVGLLYVM